MDADSGQGAFEAQATYLKDYRPPDFLVDTIDLTFELNESDTLVRSRLSLRRNPQAAQEDPLHLDGEALELVSISLDGTPLDSAQYTVEETGLIIRNPPPELVLEIETRIEPDKNTALQGLYVSGNNFFTQCEAQGFRRITFFPDRPDVMATFRTRITAEKEKFPVLLSNGNLISHGPVDSDPGRHFAEWHDPFPKPSYLFALVAGDLAVMNDAYETGSGRKIDLQIYAEAGDLDKCGHAMESLKRAMAWDEEVYGLEYDLDRFMVVAVSDFNMGAMENKGLNIFNTKCVLAKPETATDTDFEWVESVVAHEYFHNWTGNRVTCRDWFQLSLKEGLTVFRDQQFTADMGSEAVTRIDGVRQLRASQFPEDSGPLAHPVRPENYIEINNFYTSTVYNKGAELVRMIHRIVGADGFRKGMDLYFERHDGQAVTIEDFVAAMEGANGVDLAQFRHWYSQAGTPQVDIAEEFDADNGTLKLTVSQTTAPTPGQRHKQPFHIPIAIGLIGQDGNDLPVRLVGDNTPGDPPKTRVLNLQQSKQEFILTGLTDKPTLSPLRGFSAPIRLTRQPIDRLKIQFAKDNDPFARWEAGQQLATRLLLDMAYDIQSGRQASLDADFITAVRQTLEDDRLDNALRAKAIGLPSLSYLAEQMTIIDMAAIDQARQLAMTTIADALDRLFQSTYAALADDGPYRYEPEDVGRRALRNRALDYICAANDTEEGLNLAVAQIEHATNMTDRMAALAILNNHDDPRRSAALDRFYGIWTNDALVIDKWFTLQAQTRLPDALERVKTLMDHPAFTLSNPNRARALIAGFASGNPLRFHRPDGAGYDYLADCIVRIDRLNPQLAARLVAPLGRWHRHQEKQSSAMKRALEAILASERLSKDTYELAGKSLQPEG